MDDTKKELLKQVFWDMNELSSFTSTVPGENDDEEDTTTLHIYVTAKTASEIADVYGFNTDQRQQLAELLSTNTGNCGVPFSMASGPAAARSWPWRCPRWAT